jgi:hypothetical protein
LIPYNQAGKLAFSAWGRRINIESFFRWRKRMSDRIIGTVKWFNAAKGYGFIGRKMARMFALSAINLMAIAA